MNSPLLQLRSRPYYFIPLFLLMGLLVIFCFKYTRLQSFQFLNAYHCRWLDFFFVKYTLSGDGLVSIVVVLLLAICRRRKEAATMLVAYITSGLATQLLKKAVDLPRPRLYFEQTMVKYQHFVAGVTLHNHSSFPSGHAASA